MNHGTVESLPDYMAKSGERQAHPFLMYDNIMMTPSLLEGCLEPACTAAVRDIATTLVERGVERIFFSGCGTSLFVGEQLVYAFEQLAGMQADAREPFEMTAYPPVGLDARAALIVISHSGNTLTDRRAADLARRRGAYVACLTDNPEAKLLQSVDAVVIGPGGRDMAIPKTRSYTTALMRGLMLASEVAKAKGRADLSVEIRSLPELSREVLGGAEEQIKRLVRDWSDVDRYLAAGPGPNGWTAVEAALKIMETVGLPAFGFELEEYTHGPELSLKETSGVILFQPDSPLIDRGLTAARATVAAGSKTLVVTSVPEAEWADGATVLAVPRVHDLLSPVLMILPAQLLVYYTALRLGLKPDMAGTDNPKIRDAILILHPVGTH